MPRRRLIHPRDANFVREPVSARNAANVIVFATAIVVVVGGILMWLLDHDEYPNVGRGLWWAMQTVTTVGYGDVTPQKTSGRIVAAAVMLWGIAFLAILIAGITSGFVARAEKKRALEEAQEEELEEVRLYARLDDLAARLERVEQTLSELARR